MILEDWHTHNQLCHHATGTIEDYIKKAVDFKLNTIGISDHFPYDFFKGIRAIPYEEYAMPLIKVEGYLKNAESLKEQFKDKIKVKIGFEIEFMINQEKAINSHLNKYIHYLDYILGSVHVIEEKNSMWCVDESKHLAKFDYYGVDNVYFKYYNKVQKMLNSKEFKLDIVTHLDLPKKFKKFPTNKEKIMNEVVRILEIVKKNGLTMEINTSGFRKDVKEQYPNQEIVQKMHELDIPILLGSDAHAPNEVGWEFNVMIEKLKKIGYNQLAHYNKRKRTFVEI